MSRALKNYSGHERRKVVKRRLAQPEANRGLGYWAAVDSKEREEKSKREDQKDA